MTLPEVTSYNQLVEQIGLPVAFGYWWVFVWAFLVFFLFGWYYADGRVQAQEDQAHKELLDRLRGREE